MPTTDEQVENKRKDVEGLREQIADTVAEIARKQREMDNDNVMTGLVAEEKRLKEELAQHQKTLKSLDDDTSTEQAEPAEQPATPTTQAPASSNRASADKSADSSTNGKG